LLKPRFEGIQQPQGGQWEKERDSGQPRLVGVLQTSQLYSSNRARCQKHIMLDLLEEDEALKLFLKTCLISKPACELMFEERGRKGDGHHVKTGASQWHLMSFKNRDSQSSAGFSKHSSSDQPDSNVAGKEVACPTQTKSSPFSMWAHPIKIWRMCRLNLCL
jgi:hypothetical protein